MQPPLANLIPSLRKLATELRIRVCAGDLDPSSTTKPWTQSEAVGMGQGDVTFAPDEAAEEILDAWFQAQAAHAPLSLLTEDRGWRHGGPGTRPGTWRALDHFDHGGPRIAIDPIDGTRPWLHDLRSAWTVISAAPPGPGIPRLSDLQWGMVAEIPDSSAGKIQILEATRGTGCLRTEMALPFVSERLSPTGTGSAPTQPLQERLTTPDLAKVDHGFFPFFAYHPSIRARVAALAWEFFQALEREEDAQIDQCYDDQYTASGGQLALLSMGKYAMVCDPRPLVPNELGEQTQCAKPYDVAGAILCAMEAGCIVLDLTGAPIDFPIDTKTSVGWFGFPGKVSASRLQPHLQPILLALSRA